MSTEEWLLRFIYFYCFHIKAAFGRFIHAHISQSALSAYMQCLAWALTQPDMVLVSSSDMNQSFSWLNQAVFFDIQV